MAQLKNSHLVVFSFERRKWEERKENEKKDLGVCWGTREGESEGVTGEGDVVAGTEGNSDRARWELERAKVKKDQNP